MLVLRVAMPEFAVKTAAPAEDCTVYRQGERMHAASGHSHRSLLRQAPNLLQRMRLVVLLVPLTTPEDPRS